MIWSIGLDGVVIVLLAAGIVYAWRLERMLRGLDKNRADMEKFLAVFSATIARAEKGIRDLQDTAQDSGVETDRAIARATALRDELSYLIDAADRIANRLTENSSSAIARAPLAVPVAEEPAPAPLAQPVPVPDVAAEKEKQVPPWAKRATEKHVVINRTEKPAEKPPAAPEKNERGALRSEAERELQQALEKMRS